MTGTKPLTAWMVGNAHGAAHRVLCNVPVAFSNPTLLYESTLPIACPDAMCSHRSRPLAFSSLSYVITMTIPPPNGAAKSNSKPQAVKGRGYSNLMQHLRAHHPNYQTQLADAGTDETESIQSWVSHKALMGQVNRRRRSTLRVLEEA